MIAVIERIGDERENVAVASQRQQIRLAYLALVARR
jgi:hypothetical protein